MNIATATFDAMTRDDRWLGYGYLGERQNIRDGVASGELDRGLLDTLENMDRAAYGIAQARGLTADELFHWANSKSGRWFADCYGTDHARNYAPTAREARLAAEYEG